MNPIGPGCVHLGVENIHKVGAIGVPGYNWEAKIVDEKRQPVAQGEVGELAVKGPGVMKCYYNDPKATAAVLKMAGYIPVIWQKWMKMALFIWLIGKKM